MTKRGWKIVKKIITFIKEKQVLCFFLLTYLLSWFVWFLVPVLSDDVRIQNLIIYIGFYGPGVSAVIMAGTLNLDNQPAPSLRYWITYSASFLVIFIINFLSMNVLNIPVNTNSLLLMAVIALLAAMILSGPVSKNKGIRRLLRYIKKAKVHWKWYAVAILGVPVLTLISLLIDLLLGGKPEGSFLTLPVHIEIYNRVILFLSIFIFGSAALGQEPGWRGFALHRLLTKFNPLVASVIIGALWSFWNAPLYLIGFYEGGIPALLIRFLWNIPLAIPFTWLYMKTHGSLLHVALFHASINTLGLFVPVTTRSAYILIILSILSIIAITIENRLWTKRDSLTPFRSKTLF